MKIKYLALPAAILVMTTALGLQGYRLKSQIIEPLNLERFQNASIFELPFMAKTDEELKFYVENVEQLLHPTPTPTPNPTPSTSPDPSGDAVPNPTQPTQPQPTVAPDPDGPTLEFPDGVADSWFDNTLFVGDSRMEGLALNCKISNADYFCKQGLTIGSVQTKEIDGKKLSEVLSGKKYEKIIVNFGLNEAGNSEEWFRRNVDSFIALVRSTQPDAVIIFNAIMPVTRSYISSSKYGSSFLPDKLEKRSSIFESYANDSDIFFIDCRPYFSDQEGYLYSGLTGDGCHPTAKHYGTWFRWMRYALSLLPIS